MTQNRRDFLKASSFVALGLGAPAFLTRTALAAPNANKRGAKDSILVVIELAGGNDGLNTVVPFKNELYHKQRPTLKIRPEQVLKLNDELGLNPNMGGLAGLHNDSELCVVQGVGYPNPTQSHFRSMDIWQAASREAELTEGWIGKALKSLPGAGGFHLSSDNERAPLALGGAPVRVPSITSLEQFQLQVGGATGKDQMKQRKLIEEAAKPKTGQPGLLDFVQRTASSTYESSQRLREIGRNYEPKAVYPATALADRLKLAAQLIDGDLGARVFYVRLNGFDTHAAQAPAHNALMQTLSGAMTAFYKDMKARGHGERVLVMTFSEFGRRPYENGSRGTDHGAAAPMLLAGGKVNPGVHGKHPSLEKKDTRFGNLKHSIDFRQVYATLLDKWLGVPHKNVLGEEYKPLELIKG